MRPSRSRSGVPARPVADLGSFGNAKPPLDPEQVDDFGYFDIRVRVNPGFGDLDLADFLDSATAVDTDDIRAAGFVKEALRAAVHPEDFDAFWSTAKRERQGIEDVLEVLILAIEAVTARPTVRPSDSSDGPGSTTLSSVGGSSSRVIERLEAEGRPSVAVMVRNAASA